MTDTIATIADLADSGDDELVFDDVDAAAAQAAAVPVPEPARPRRAPRRGRDGVAAHTQSETPPEPDPIRASAAAHPAVAEEPAGPPAPVPQPDAGPAGFDRRTMMLLAIVLFAFFTSLVSVGGLIAVGRTLAEAQADRAQAEDDKVALARVPVIVKALDDASARLQVAASRVPAGGTPATAADVHQALDELRVALAAHQPDGLASLNGMTRDGFSELGTRLDRLSQDVEGMGRGVSASRPIPRAAYSRQPS